MRGAGCRRPQMQMSIARTDIDLPAVEQLNAISTTQDRLEMLMAEIVNRRMSTSCYDLVRYLAYMTPFQRLKYNIKNTLWLMGYRLKVAQGLNEDPAAINVLIDGLTYEERQVLMEIDSSGASLEARRTAHSLMDLEVRQKLAENLGGTFKDRWERRSHKLVSKPLDETVNI